MDHLVELHELAKRALNKKNDSGLDINLDGFAVESNTPPKEMISIDQMEPEDAEVMASVGVYPSQAQRSGTYVLRDFHPLCLMGGSGDLELLTLADAVRKYDWLREDYYWKAVPVDLDKYTARCALAAEPSGYFIRVKKGAKIPHPVQTGLCIAQNNLVQAVHNIVILEEDSELNLITGCTTRHSVETAVHLGVTECYIGRNARLTTTMVHNWSPEVEVRPRAGTVVEEGGRFVSNYCSLRPAKSIQSNPRAWLRGVNATAKYVTVVLGTKGSTIDIGGEIHLDGIDSRAEILSRSVSTGGQVYQRGLLVGNAKDCRGHLDCAGMILDSGQGGSIQAFPGLRALHPDARLSHEASIGKVAPEQVAYLQSRGMTEAEAVSMIVRGFLDVDLVGLGPELNEQISRIADISGHVQS